MMQVYILTKNGVPMGVSTEVEKLFMTHLPDITVGQIMDIKEKLHRSNHEAFYIGPQDARNPTKYRIDYLWVH